MKFEQPKKIFLNLIQNPIFAPLLIIILSYISYFFFLVPKDVKPTDYFYYLDSYNDNCEKLQRDAKIFGQVFFSQYGPVIPAFNSGAIEYSFKKNEDAEPLIWFKTYFVQGYSNKILVSGEKSKEAKIYNDAFDLFYHPLRVGNLGKSKSWTIRFEGFLSDTQEADLAYLNDMIRVTWADFRKLCLFSSLIFLVFFALSTRNIYFLFIWKTGSIKTTSDNICYLISFCSIIVSTIIIRLIPQVIPASIYIFLLIFLATTILRYFRKNLTREELLGIALCVVLAFAATHLSFYYKTTEPQRGGDSMWYDDVAKQLLKRDAHSLYGRPGFYPLFLMLIYEIGGWGNDFAVIKSQILINFLATFLLFFVFYNLTNRIILSTVLSVISQFHIQYHFWTGWILSENISGALFLFSIFFLSLWLINEKKIFIVCSALCLSALAHTRGVMQLLFIVWCFVIIVFALHNYLLKRHFYFSKKIAEKNRFVFLWRRYLIAMILFFGINLFFVGGWMVRNYILYGNFAFTGWRGLNLFSHFATIFDKATPKNTTEQKTLNAYEKIKSQKIINESDYMKMFNKISEETKISQNDLDIIINNICKRLIWQESQHYLQGVREALYHYFRENVPGHSNSIDAFYFSIPMIGRFAEFWNGWNWFHSKLRTLGALIIIGFLGLIVSYKNPGMFAFILTIWLSFIYLILVSCLSVLSPADYGRYRMPVELLYITLPILVAWIYGEKIFVLCLNLFNKNIKIKGKTKKEEKDKTIKRRRKK